jgi:hypothetical protein
MVTLADIEGLIGQSESLTLEFKDGRGVGQLEEVARQATAMANTRGGRIVYGIGEADKPNSPMSVAQELRPITNPSSYADRASAYLAHHVSPKLPTFEVNAIFAAAGSHEGYVVIDVGESIRGHASSDGHFYRRHSYGVHRLDERELRELLALANRADLELVGIVPGSYEVAPLTGLGATIIGVRNSGSITEVLYRVTIGFEGVTVLPEAYDPSGNRNYDGLLKQYGDRYVFTGTERCAVFPGDVVPILQLEYHGRNGWRAGSKIVWSISGATTPTRKGVLIVG